MFVFGGGGTFLGLTVTTMPIDQAGYVVDENDDMFIYYPGSMYFQTPYLMLRMIDLNERELTIYNKQCRLRVTNIKMFVKSVRNHNHSVDDLYRTILSRKNGDDGVVVECRTSSPTSIVDTTNTHTTTRDHTTTSTYTESSSIMITTNSPTTTTEIPNSTTQTSIPFAFSHTTNFTTTDYDNTTLHTSPASAAYRHRSRMSPRRRSTTQPLSMTTTTIASSILTTYPSLYSRRLLNENIAGYELHDNGTIKYYCYPSTNCWFVPNMFFFDLSDVNITIESLQCIMSINTYNEHKTRKFLDFVHLNNDSVEIVRQRIRSGTVDDMSYYDAFGIRFPTCYNTNDEGKNRRRRPSTGDDNNTTIPTTNVETTETNETTNVLYMDYMLDKGGLQ